MESVIKLDKFKLRIPGLFRFHNNLHLWSVIFDKERRSFYDCVQFGCVRLHGEKKKGPC
jgi:hypothetical protein